MRSPSREPVQLASKMLNGTGEGAVNGVDEDAKTVVTGGMVAATDDVAITGVDGRGLNGITDDPGAGAIWCVLAGVTPE